MVDPILAEPAVQAIKESRKGQSESHGRAYADPRSPGAKDCDRIIYSQAFHRLIGITQILPPDSQLPRVHNRLTHSLKVSQLARAVAERVIHVAKRKNQTSLVRALGGLDPSVAAAAGLAHDLGHPPFGHAGEQQLDELSYGAHSLLKTRCGFEGNAQTFHIATKLEASHGVSLGLRLTAGTRAALLKYPWPRASSGLASRKFGYYLEDKVDFSDAREWLNATCVGTGQQSLEASCMDIADDITYAVHDFEDFLALGLIRSSSVLYHCDQFVRGRRSSSKNPLETLSSKLQKDYEDRYQQPLLRQACRVVMSQNLPTASSSPSELREWRNSNLVYFLSTIRLSAEPQGNTGARVRPDVGAWHLLELLKFFSKYYVIQRQDTQVLQRAGNSLLRGCLEGLRAWTADKSGLPLPPRFSQVMEWSRAIESSPGRPYLDYLCTLSDAEVVELSDLVRGRRLPRLLHAGF